MGKKNIAILIFSFLSLSLFGQKLSNISDTTIIANATIINLDNGQLSTSMTILIANGNILSVQKNFDKRINNRANVIDAKGKYLIPGLWDMHAHVDTGKFDKQCILKLFIINGITGIRIMNGLPEHHVWRKNGTQLAFYPHYQIFTNPVLGTE
jgi:hypothetical protein